MSRREFQINLDCAPEAEQSLLHARSLEDFETTLMELARSRGVEFPKTVKADGYIAQLLGKADDYYEERMEDIAAGLLYLNQVAPGTFQLCAAMIPAIIPTNRDWEGERVHLSEPDDPDSAFTEHRTAEGVERLLGGLVDYGNGTNDYSPEYWALGFAHEAMHRLLTKLGMINGGCVGEAICFKYEVLLAERIGYEGVYSLDDEAVNMGHWGDDQDELYEKLGYIGLGIHPEAAAELDRIRHRRDELLELVRPGKT